MYANEYQNAVETAVKQITDICAGRKCYSECVRRILGGRPPGARVCGGGRRSVAAAVLIVVVAVLIAALTASADVQCVWNGSGYSCSGTGSAVTVSGGGGSHDPVVTNIVGTCTNCVAMSPEQVRNFKTEALQKIDDIKSNSHHISSYLAPQIQSVLAPYAVTYPVSGSAFLNATTPNVSAVTNFVNSHPDIVGSKPYDLASDVVGASPPFTSLNSTQRAMVPAKWLACYDGAASALNEVSTAVASASNNVEQIVTSAKVIEARSDYLKSMVQYSLSDEECTAQWDGGSGDGGSGGGGNAATNQVNSNWCTYDQGESIIDLLDSIDAWFDDQEKYLKSMTNWISTVNSTIIANLNTAYTAIPPESGLGDTWQEIYLDGQRTNWGYEPTNILARIELLLYGLTGVGTNASEVAEVDQDTLESSAQSAVESLESDFTRQTDGAKSIRDALLSFCRKFEGSPHDNRNADFTPAVKVSLGSGGDGFEYEFDPVAIGQGQQQFMSSMIEFMRAACQTVYLVLFAVLGFLFWRVVFVYAVKIIRWGHEILTSIFAD